MCESVYTYVYIYTYIYIYHAWLRATTRTHVDLQAGSMYVCLHSCVCTCARVRVYKSMYVYTYMCIHMYVYSHIYVYTYIYTYRVWLYTYVCIHIYIHIYISCMTPHHYTHIYVYTYICIHIYRGISCMTLHHDAHTHGCPSRVYICYICVPQYTCICACICEIVTWMPVRLATGIHMEALNTRICEIVTWKPWILVYVKLWHGCPLQFGSLLQHINLLTYTHVQNFIAYKCIHIQCI